jgi:hypothetical protein
MSSKLTDVTVTTSSAGLTGLDALRFQLAYRPAIAFLDDVLVVSTVHFIKRSGHQSSKVFKHW